MGKLTFAKLSDIFNYLFLQRSGGAFQQYAVAALLQSLIEQSEIKGLRVETKNIFASDKSSKSAGDIQILTGTRVLEAFEISATHWTEKINSAYNIIRSHDLSRLHVIACATVDDRDGEQWKELAKKPIDISIIDLQHIVDVLIAALTRRYRAASLERLYELLDNVRCVMRPFCFQPNAIHTSSGSYRVNYTGDNATSTYQKLKIL